MSGQQKLRVPVRSTPKHRGTYSNKSISNYATMVSEEKDQYIEKLRRRNHRAWEKIQELEDNNGEFWRTIQKQQNLLEVIRGTLVKEKSDFNKQIEELRFQKDEEIVLLKTLLLNERGARGTLDTGKSNENGEPVPPAKQDSLRTSNLSSVEKLRSTKGDSDYFFNTKPIVAVAAVFSNQTEKAKSGREEIFTELLQNGGNELAQDEPLNEPHVSKKGAVNTDMEAYPQFQHKLDILNGVELENKRSKDILLETGLKRENHSEEIDNEYKVAQCSEEDKHKTLSDDKFKELVEARNEIKVKNKNAKETSLRMEQLEKSLADAEEKNRNQEYMIHKVNDLKTLLQKVKEDRAAEIMSLTHEYQLELQQKTTELETLQQQFEWMKVSKLLTVNSVAAELERLRDAQNIRPQKRITKMTSRCRLVIPLPSFFN